MIVNYNWVDKQIKKINKKDIKLREEQLENADYIFWRYIEEYPQHYKNLVFWNKEENCGNDTELGQEFFDYIDNELQKKAK